MQRLFRSFQEPSISSATRREAPRLVSYATIDLAGLRCSPESLTGRPYPNDRSATAETACEREVAREKENATAGTVARVATSIRFSSSCGEVVKTFLPLPVGIVTLAPSLVVIIYLRC